MSKQTSRFCALMLLLFSSAAHAGWYEIQNYVGTIGTAPIHLSLQTYRYINHGEKSEWRVDGSYYYDAHRVPIPLQGHLQDDEHMVLCEAIPPSSNSESPVVPAISAGHPTPCPLTLNIGTDSANGEWNDGKNALPIFLHQVGRLNDTDDAKPSITGLIAIPMWYHTPTHMLLGVYQMTEDCPVSMRHLQLINIATGRIDGDMAFDCQAGMVMTAIYQNVSRGSKTEQITVGYDGGKMGHDEVFDIRPHLTQKK